VCAGQTHCRVVADLNGDKGQAHHAGEASSSSVGLGTCLSSDGRQWLLFGWSVRVCSRITRPWDCHRDVEPRLQLTRHPSVSVLCQSKDTSRPRSFLRRPGSPLVLLSWPVAIAIRSLTTATRRMILSLPFRGIMLVGTLNRT